MYSLYNKAVGRYRRHHPDVNRLRRTSYSHLNLRRPSAHSREPPSRVDSHVVVVGSKGDVRMARDVTSSPVGEFGVNGDYVVVHLLVDRDLVVADPKVRNRFMHAHAHKKLERNVGHNACVPMSNLPNGLAYGNCGEQDVRSWWAALC